MARRRQRHDEHLQECPEPEFVSQNISASRLQDSLRLTFGPHCGPSVARNIEVHDSPEIKFQARPPGGSEEWGHIWGHGNSKCQKTIVITGA
jgi:hypothetical protein